jgi:predicted membrane protein (TIGR00267 family)
MMKSNIKNWNDRIIRYIRQLVFGFEDALVSTLGAVTGIAGGSQDNFVVVLAGMVIIFVESLSMGVGAYLSSKSENEVIEAVGQREKELMKWDIEGEKEEIREYLRKHDFDDKEIETIVEKIISKPKLLFEEMMLHEYKMFPEPRERAIKRGLVMWGSYFVGGFFPVLPYLFLPVQTALYVSIAVTVVVLFVFGALRTKFTNRAWWKSGLEMAGLSLSAALIGYAVGRIVAVAFGL